MKIYKLILSNYNKLLLTLNNASSFVIINSLLSGITASIIK